MRRHVKNFIRLWRRSPLFAVLYVHRKIRRQAKKIIPLDEWNAKWLGEEMRPFNSLRSN